jgi:hypothetical protein
MSPYRIILHGEEETVVAEQTRLFEHDDAAIDHTGRINHPYGMSVWQGDRLVARFPPLG